MRGAVYLPPRHPTADDTNYAGNSTKTNTVAEEKEILAAGHGNARV